MRQQIQTEPRSFWSLFFAHHGWLAVVATVLLLILTYFSITNYALGRAFADGGEQIMATVTDKEESVGEDSTSYFLSLAYDVDDTRYEADKRVTQSVFRGAAMGDAQPVFILPDRPDKMALTRDEYREGGIVFQVLAAVFGLGAVIGLRMSGMPAARAVRARRVGRQLQAEVTDHLRLRNKKGDLSGRAKLRWKDAEGGLGESMAHEVDALQPHTPGTSITVYKGPQTSWWEGDVGPRRGTEG